MEQDAFRIDDGAVWAREAAGPVVAIADEWPAGVGSVDADLMGATRLGIELEEYVTPRRRGWSPRSTNA